MINWVDSGVTLLPSLPLLSTVQGGVCVVTLRPLMVVLRSIIISECLHPWLSCRVLVVVRVLARRSAQKPSALRSPVTLDRRVHVRFARCCPRPSLLASIRGHTQGGALGSIVFSFEPLVTLKSDCLEIG